LNRAFFQRIARSLAASFLVKLAMRAGEAVAVAVFFRSADTLYGRYWGADADYHSLHFEACYYQGIDYCIANGLATFEPGTQGEHKIARGFEPALTGRRTGLRTGAAARDRCYLTPRGPGDRRLRQ